MKYLFLLLIFASSDIYAGNKGCSGYSILAEHIMRGRQNNYTQEELIDMTIDRDDPDITYLSLDLIVNAYKWPLAPTKEEKETFAYSFSGKAYKFCMDTMEARL
jgi:hypothetical protein